ncbi:MAG: hypothetical protein ABR905_19595 [Terracidiphilus sp.]
MTTLTLPVRAAARYLRASQKAIENFDNPYLGTRCGQIPLGWNLSSGITK